MKKFLTLALLSLSSLAFVPSSAEAKAVDSNTVATVAAAPQIIIRTPRRTRIRPIQRRTRVTTTVRTVRRGRFLYRETYRTTYLANGRINNRLISRRIIRRY